MIKLNKILSTLAVVLLASCVNTNEVAETRRFTEPRFSETNRKGINVLEFLIFGAEPLRVYLTLPYPPVVTNTLGFII